MKTIIYKSGILILLIAMAVACSEDKVERGMETKLVAADIKMDITPDPKDPNLIHFKLLTPNSQAKFECPKAQINLVSNSFAKKILFADDYVLTVTAYNTAGRIEPVTIPFTVETTDPTVCTNENFRLLTGGCDVEGGKVWRLNDKMDGAVGCGDNNSTTNNWWAPSPSEDWLGYAYEDELTFHLNSSQLVVAKSGSPETAGWNFSTDNYGNLVLELVDVVPCYQALDTQGSGTTRYRVFQLTEDAMQITCYESGGTAWHYFFTSEPR